ncbi:hypothetical protein BVX94_02435 [bacterium B17]|nr:hypothetical protein BVX94_02435 [bacterium B17]
MEISFTNFMGRGPLTNFPVLVKLTTNNTAGYNGFLDTTNGWDLRFWDNEELTGTELSYEIERWSLPEQTQDPTNVSGCVLWLDSSDIDGNFDGATGDPGIGADVTNWVDKSGSGNYAAPLSTEPTVATNSTIGKHVVRWGWNPPKIDFGTPITANGSTVFLVYNNDPAYGVNKQLIVGASDNFYTSDAGGYRCFSGGNVAIAPHNSSVASENWSVHTIQITSGNYKFWYNGDLKGTDTDADSFDPFTQLGSAFANVAEVLIYNRELTDEEHKKVGMYLAEKYSLDTDYDAGGDSYVWVQVPEFTNNVSIWASWGNSRHNFKRDYTTDGSVWSDFSAVYHLSEESGTRTDSTEFQNDADEYGTPQYVDGSAGKIHGSLYLDSSGDYLQSGMTEGIPKTNEARSIFLWHNSSGGNGSALSIGEKASNERWSIYMDGNQNHRIVAESHDDGTWRGGFSDNTWGFLGVTWDGSNATYYLNGADVGTWETTEFNTKSNYPVCIGKNAHPDTDDYRTGYYDEIRISSLPRGSNWVWASWMNQGDNHDNFQQYGSVEFGTHIDAVDDSDYFDFIYTVDMEDSDREEDFDDWAVTPAFNFLMGNSTTATNNGWFAEDVFVATSNSPGMTLADSLPNMLAFDDTVGGSQPFLVSTNYSYGIGTVYFSQNAIQDNSIPIQFKIETSTNLSTWIIQAELTEEEVQYWMKFIISMII